MEPDRARGVKKGWGFESGFKRSLGQGSGIFRLTDPGALKCRSFGSVVRVPSSETAQCMDPEINVWFLMCPN